MEETLEDGPRETSSSFWWWFSLNRENGGPAYHQWHIPCPAEEYFHIIVSFAVFLFPLFLCVILMPSIRSRSRSSLLVVILCFGTGFLLTVVYGSSSWLVGKVDVNVSIGPQRPPVQGTVKVWAGLWHVTLTYVTEGFFVNKRIDWTLRKDLVAAHKKALRDGWPWALTSVTAELGGEGTTWRGQLGDGLMEAGLAASILLVTAIMMWGVWVLLFLVSPQLTPKLIMLSGVILATCSLMYVMCVSGRVPHILHVAGTKMELNMGLAWWVTIALGFSLTLVGLLLLFYKIYRPGHFATVFELDFGLPNHRLYNYTHESSKSLSAFEEDGIPMYTHGYPWPHLFMDTNLSPDNDAVQHKETKEIIDQASQEQIEETVTGKTISFNQSGKSKNSSETQKTIDEENDVACEDEVSPTFTTSTLKDDQDHTVFNLQSTITTLRRRSPEQPQERDLKPSSQQENLTPVTKIDDVASARTKNKFPNNHSTLLVEKYVPKTNALLRTPLMSNSMRKLSKMKSRLPTKYRSSLRRKSVSMSRLVLPSTARQDFEETKEKNEEWVQVGEELVPNAGEEPVTHI